jgi:hypothetical protein
MNPYLTHAAVRLPQNIPANAAARRLQNGKEYPMRLEYAGVFPTPHCSEFFGVAL